MNHTNSLIQLSHFWPNPVPVNCDDCNSKINAVFANLCVGPNQWNLFCARCAANHLAQYGFNLGQRYTKQNDGRWAKTEG
jgi:hypothetical protein